MPSLILRDGVIEIFIKVDDFCIEISPILEDERNELKSNR